MDGELLIRMARLDERPAMERICANAFEWGDYVPEVWDDWLADGTHSRAEGDRRGAVIVGEVTELVARLPKAIRVHTAQVGAVWVSAMLPDLDWLRDAFNITGYGFGDWLGELWIFERCLNQQGGGPRGG